MHSLINHGHGGVWVRANCKSQEMGGPISGITRVIPKSPREGGCPKGHSGRPIDQLLFKGQLHVSLSVVTDGQNLFKQSFIKTINLSSLLLLIYLKIW